MKLCPGLYYGKRNNDVLLKLGNTGDYRGTWEK